MRVYYSIPEIKYLTSIIENEYLISIDRIYLYREMGGTDYYINSKGNRFVLKIYKSFHTHSAIQSAEVMNYLEQNNYFVTPIIKNRTGGLWIKITLPEYDCIAILYNYIQGEHPDVLENINSIGALTADLHKLMASYPKQLIPCGKKTHIDNCIKLMREYFPGRESEIIELQEYGEKMWTRAEKLPVGICHDDLHNFNMIVQEGNIYLLDFDTISNEHPMFDVASICDETGFWKVSKGDIDKTLYLLDKFNNAYSKLSYLSDIELSSVFDCIAIRHYRLHGNNEKIMMKGCSHMTEQWFNNLYMWLVDYRELTEKYN